MSNSRSSIRLSDDSWMFFACTLALFFPAITVVYHVTGFNVFELFSPSASNDPQDAHMFMYYISPSLAGICGLIAIQRFLVFRRLRTEGVEVAGLVVQLGRKYHGYQDLHYSYTYSGKTYSKKRSFGSDPLSRLRVRDDLVIVVNPRSPAEHMVAFPR